MLHNFVEVSRNSYSIAAIFGEVLGHYSQRKITGLNLSLLNDVLRQSGKHGLMDLAAVERWLQYRKNRNSTAHDYSEAFANETLKLLPDYLIDARALSINMKKVFDAS